MRNALISNSTANLSLWANSINDFVQVSNALRPQIMYANKVSKNLLNVSVCKFYAYERVHFQASKWHKYTQKSKSKSVTADVAYAGRPIRGRVEKQSQINKILPCK